MQRPTKTPAAAQLETLRSMLAHIDGMAADVFVGAVAKGEIRKARGKIADAMRDLERAITLADERGDS